MLTMADLPADLPAGRLITPDPSYTDEPAPGPTLWVSTVRDAQAGPQWTRLLAEHARTGLWPLLLNTLSHPRRGDSGRPWLAGELEPIPDEATRQVEVDDVLAERWAEATGQDSVDFGSDAGRPVPFRSWPGLAPAAAPGVDPDEHAAALVADPAGMRMLAGGTERYLGLVRSSDSAGAIGAAGWLHPAGRTVDAVAVVRTWQSRFGVRVCALGFDTLGLSVAWPPRTREHAMRIAAEHYAFCSDNVDQSETVENGVLIEAIDGFDDYAESLIHAPVWTFWWD